MSVFGDGVFKEVIKLKGWALMQYDYCPYKKHAQREDYMKTKAEDGHFRRQGERSEEKPALLTPGSQTSSLQRYKKIHLPV